VTNHAIGRVRDTCLLLPRHIPRASRLAPRFPPRRFPSTLAALPPRLPPRWPTLPPPVPPPARGRGRRLACPSLPHSTSSKPPATNPPRPQTLTSTHGHRRHHRCQFTTQAAAPRLHHHFSPPLQSPLHHRPLSSESELTSAKSFTNPSGKGSRDPDRAVEFPFMIYSSFP
jgi:hypothetical protein